MHKLVACFSSLFKREKILFLLRLNSVNSLFNKLFLRFIKIIFLIRAALLRWLYHQPKYTVAITLARASQFGEITTRDARAFLRGWTHYVPWNLLLLLHIKHDWEFVEALPLQSWLKDQYIPSEKEILHLSQQIDLLCVPFGNFAAPEAPPYPVVFYFRDIQDYFFPNSFSLEELSKKRNCYRSARKYADHLIVPSEFSKKSISACLKIPEKYFSVIPSPIDKLSFKKKKPRKMSDRPFIYYPAENKPYKNHDRLFQAITKLITKGWKGWLVCSGEMSDNASNLEILAKQNGIQDHVIFLKKITPAETSWLYHHAELLIFPSLFEGYTVPLLEAFEAKLPVICSGVTSLPELGGEAVLYCNPFEVDDIAEKIWTLWNDKELRVSLISRGTKQSQLFTTKKIIQQHVQLFSQIIQNASKKKDYQVTVDALPGIDLNLAEDLYRKSKDVKIQQDIPLRDDWLSANQHDVMRQHCTEYSLQAPPKPKEHRGTLDQAASLPVHFFTIVYNGMPFIEKHLAVFRQLPFEWHWHIIEGAAKLVGDTAWSLSHGGQLPMNASFLSEDGTKEYLDKIAAEFPQNITLYRKSEYWHGKLEMISAPVASLPKEALLWEIDVDEIWNADQIITLVKQFIQEPKRTGAAFYCRFFVSPNHVADNLGAYGNNSDSLWEWRRVWKYRAGDHWGSHEPPLLLRKKGNDFQDVMTINPFTHQETWRMGLVFDHFAFATKKQLKFKETYYGYSGAVKAFEKMIKDDNKEILVNKYYSWIKDPIWAFRDNLFSQSTEDCEELRSAGARSITDVSPLNSCAPSTSCSSSASATLKTDSKNIKHTE